MANSLSASFRTLWAREMQQVFWVTNVWRPQANFRLEAELKDGDTVKRVYRSSMVPQAYTRYTDVTFQDLTNTSESLVVNVTPTIPFVISDLDELQSFPDSRSRYTKDAVEQMNNIINGYYLKEVTNATSVIDAADFGGTAANGAVVTTANIQKVFALAQKKLGRLNVFQPGGKNSNFANLTPDIYQVLLEYLAGKESVLGDRAGENGYAGTYFGFDLYVSNGMYWTGQVALATTPTAADTLTLKVGPNTVLFTFVSSIGSTAGNVLIAGSATLTRDNLAALINTPGTTTANGVALSAANQAAIYGWTAANSGNNVTITGRGAGAPVTSSSLTAASDGWSSGKNISHCLFGEKGSVDFVIQKQPNIQVDAAENRIGEWKIKPYTLFGLKTFADGVKRLVDVKVDTTSYT